MSQIQKKFIAPDAVDESKIKLNNDGAIRSRNFADSADVDLIKLNASDEAQIDQDLNMNASDIVNVGLVDGRDVSVDGANLDSHLNGGPSKHDATEVDYEQSDGSKKDIQATSDDVENALRDLDNFKISRAGLIPFTANQSFGGFKATNLADPTSNQDAATKFYVDSAISGASEFSDSLFRIKDNGDPTKKIAFEASGIATATTRTITMPDSNVDLGKVATAIQKDGSVTFTANQPMGGFKLTGLAAGSGAGDSVRYEQAILVSGANAFAANQSFGGFKATNLADPTSNQDAVTLSYFNARLLGLKPKESVRVAANSNISISSGLENGDVVDGITLATGDRVLLFAQTAPEENGIYVASASGAASRASDFDSLSPIDEVNGSWFPAREGSYAGLTFVQYGVVAVLETDPINFEYYDFNANLIGGDMISKTGSTFSVDLASDAGLESSNPGNVAGQLRVKLDGATLSRSSSGLKVSTGGISNNEVNAAAAIAYSKLNLSNSIVNADINAAAAIAYSKLNLSNSIVNADIAAGAAIADSKLATISTANKVSGSAVQLNASGALEDSTGLRVRVDGSTVKRNGSNNLEALKAHSQKITLSGTDITNQYVDLAQAAYSAASISLVPVGGIEQEQAVDYTVSLTGGSGGVTRLTFAGDLATGGAAELVAADKLVVKYSYL